MGYHYLDMASYKRKSHFDYFRGMAYPYVGLTAQVDITSLLTTVKAKKLPFFLSFCYCVAQAANRVPQLRQRIMDERIAEFSFCKTSHTVSLEDGTYCYCSLDANMPFQAYLPYALAAQEDAKVSKSTEDSAAEQDELLFISSLPWLSYTALVNPVPHPADSNPRITWGKFYAQGAQTLIPVSILCNHALVDGLHIAQFYQALDEQIALLVAELL